MQLEVITREPTTAARPTPLLCVDGMWGGAWSWDEYFLPYFAEHGYTAHAMSLRGHGQSEGRIFGSRIRHYVQDVAQVAASLPTPPVVIGHSMGGFIVQKYLESHPAPAGVLVASAPPQGIPFSMVWRILRAMPLALLWSALTLRTRPMMNTPERAQFHLFSAGLAADRLARYHATLCDESVLAVLDMVGLERVRPPKITTPLLVLGAGADAVIIPEQCAVTARAYGTEVVMIPNVAHRIQLEDNWPVAADVILAWLAERGL